MMLLVFTANVAVAHRYVLLLAGGMLLLVWCQLSEKPLHATWQMLRRLRFFFISILILYFWFIPGDAIISAWPTLSPTVEGVLLAVERIVSLVFIVMAVNVLFVTTQTSAMIAGLYWLGLPLTYLGFSRTQFVVRTILTLELIKNNKRSDGWLAKPPSVASHSLQDKFDILVNALLNPLVDVFNQSYEPVELCFDAQSCPSWFQWSVPLLMMVLFWWVA